MGGGIFDSVWANTISKGPRGALKGSPARARRCLVHLCRADAWSTVGQSTYAADAWSTTYAAADAWSTVGQPTYAAAAADAWSTWCVRLAVRHGAQSEDYCAFGFGDPPGEEPGEEGCVGGRLLCFWI